MAGYLAPNIAKNTLIPHGVQMLFKRTGSTSFVDLGDLSDVSLTPAVEFLEYSSNQAAKDAIAKRIGQNKGMTIEATINEITPETLRIAFYGNAASTVSSETLTAVEKITVAAGTTGSVAMNILFDATSITSVKSASGKVYTGESSSGATGTSTDDWYFDTDSASKTLGLVAATDPIVNDGGEIVEDADGIAIDLIVEYTYTKAVDKLEIGKEDQQTGIVEFHIRNNEGGLGQVVTLNDVHIATSGAIPLSPDAVQNFPITVTALVKNGTLGHTAYFNV